MTITLPSTVTYATFGELDGVRVETAQASAELVFQGAQLIGWQPADADPVVFVSEHALFVRGTSVRGGIPLCGPWFGPGRSLDRKPSHGFYRCAPWRLTGATTDGDDVLLTLELDHSDLAGVNGADGWPDDAALRFEVRVGTTLSVALTTRTGADGMDLEEALHTYFVVGDVRQTRVEGLAEASYVDKVSGGASKTQSGAVTFNGETDRVYASTATTTIVDPVLGRRIVVSKSDSASTVVWNPWDKKAAAVSDLGDDEWPRMVCVETANALEQAVVIPPDTEHTISATFAVESIAS